MDFDLLSSLERATQQGVEIGILRTKIVIINWIMENGDFKTAREISAGILKLAISSGPDPRPTPPPVFVPEK